MIITLSHNDDYNSYSLCIVLFLYFNGAKVKFPSAPREITGGTRTRGEQKAPRVMGHKKSNTSLDGWSNLQLSINCSLSTFKAPLLYPPKRKSSTVTYLKVTALYY